MNQLMRFPSSVKRDPSIEAWMNENSGELGSIAHYWFEVMRDCGDDVRELLHDGHPTAATAEAVARASVGIAMGTGTDVARESAGITLVQGDLRGIVRARKLSKATLRNIRQNLAFAFGYNSLGVL